MKKILLLVFLIVAVQNCCSQADDRWKYIISDDGTDIYIDVQTIQKTISVITYWRCDIYNTPQTETKENDEPFSFDQLRVQESYDYEKKQTKYTTIVFYNGNSAVYRYENQAPKWHSVVPGTTQEAIANYAFISAIFQESKEKNR